MKTFSTSGTGSGQSLSEIESNNIPVYSTEADLDTDLANLADGELALYPSEGASLSVPVDEVKSGDMHAVTSNAVAEAIYTSFEVVTGFNTSYVASSYVTKIVVGNICVISGWIEVINSIPLGTVITNANSVPATSAQYARGMLQCQGNCRSIEITTDGKIGVPNTTQAITVGYWDINIVYPC